MAALAGPGPPTPFGFEDTACGRRILREVQSRTDGASDQVAGAIGADAFEYLGGTLAAEGALIGTDTGIWCVWRQILAAALAVGAKFECRHLKVPSVACIGAGSSFAGYRQMRTAPWHSNCSRSFPEVP